MLRLALPRTARAAIACFVLAASGSALAQDADSLFDDGVEAYRRGDDAAAIEAFKGALAANPGHDDAFRMWQRVEGQVLQEMLIEAGELGSLTARFLELAKVGREEARTDPGGAADVVDRYMSGDALQQRQALLEMQATYGPWAVPALIGPLADRAEPERRVAAIQALLRLGDDAVAPLMATLQSDDELTRTNAASVLGSLRDVRAAAALAWMAQGDPSEAAREVALGALAKMQGEAQAMGIEARDATGLTQALTERWLSGDAGLSRPYDGAAIAWEWTDGGLEGTAVLAGLEDLMLAESALRAALAAGAGDAVRGHLAAVHAAQKAEITAAQRLPSLDGNELLDNAVAELPGLELDLALAGQHRAAALELLLAKRQPGAAAALLGSMGRSTAEVNAMRRALEVRDPSVSGAAALALGSLGDTDPSVVGRLGQAIGHVPDRLAMALGDTGLTAEGPGWALLTSQDVVAGMARAKAFPPKDVILVQDGLQGVTLDTLVFGLQNDPRTAETPVVIVTDNVDGVTSLYGDQVAAVVSEASWETVAGVAPPAGEQLERAMAMARHAAHILARMPPPRVKMVADYAAANLASGADDATKAAVLHLAGAAGLSTCVPGAEAIVLDGGSDELVLAAVRACGQLWAMNPPVGDREALAATLSGMLEGDAELARAAAEALGQLGGDAVASAR